MFANIYFASLIIILKGSHGLKSVIMTVPELVKSGDTVTLACNYNLEERSLYAIKWYLDNEEFYRYVPKEAPPSWTFSTPYFNVDIDKSGPTEVTLRNVDMKLSGIYKCEVSEDAPLFHTVVKTGHMRVVELPDAPPLLSIEPEKVEIGGRIAATCETQESIPPANISWYINDELIPETHDDVRIFPTKNPKGNRPNLRRSSSRVEIIANRSFFTPGPMVVRCEASVYTLWSEGTDGLVKEEVPFLAPVLLSTSSQTQEDDNFDFFGSGASSLHKPILAVYSLHLLQQLRER